MNKKVIFSSLILLVLMSFATLEAGNPLSASLKKAEIDALTFMREEELLAHDVYTALSGIYSKPVFRNISKSETVHADAVKDLFEKYGLKDPAADHKPGVFVNAKLQELYNKLIISGKESLEGALTAGAIIEDTDIADLERLSAEVDNQDIKIVFDNLIRGSRNHLRAFHRNLIALGVTYTPRQLTKEQYNEIVKSAHETGNGSCIKARSGSPE